jgi:uncharacterized membrane protein
VIIRNALVAGASVGGLYASRHMYLKAGRAARGELTEKSVVETPAAKLFLGQPNSLLGLVYYGALLASLPLSSSSTVRGARKIAAGLAAASSAYLGYSLLFRTKMACPYCWTSHILNFAILGTLLVSE